VIGYKILTHDLCPPIQGGPPLFDGQTPCELQEVALDRSQKECAAGWNFARSLAAGFRIAGLWSDGYPARAFVVEADKYVERGNKCRAARLRIVRAVTEEELRRGIEELSEPFGEHAPRMAESQLAWYRALGRPSRSVRDVERGLRRALQARGLDWRLERYPTARALWSARSVWVARVPGAARDAWDAWDTRAVWDMRATWLTRAATDAWTARDGAWETRAATDAWAALLVEYAALQGRGDFEPDLLTVGIRDAYEAGLALALPTKVGVLGWAMAKP
jgi:hypothetical protein